jgi:hypothetical protein
VVLNLGFEHRGTIGGVDVRWTTPEGLLSAVGDPAAGRTKAGR